MLLKFKPYVRVLLNQEELKVIISRPLKDGDLGDIFELTPMGLDIIILLKDAISKEDIIKKLGIRSQSELEEMNEILDLLIRENYIGFENEYINNEDKDIESIYERVIPIWGEIESENNNRYQIQRSIMSKKVGLIGCGTLGMGIISKLITNGVSNFILVDDDTVSRTNLTRQPAFLLKDIGKPKVEVAKQYIFDRTENPQVTIYNKKVKNLLDLTIFNDVDILVVASDEYGVDELVQKYGNEKKITLSFSGDYTGSTGKIFPIVIPGKTHNYTCAHNYLYSVIGKDKKGFKDINNKFTISSITSIADFIVSISSFEILKYLTGAMQPYLINKILFFNFANYTIDEINIDSEDCNCLNMSELEC
ncbi:MAG: ThiF family adenylyltransferase [Firmicutes bacterium]|nr:ThiF family adenylyltransferase [Bacillota bacterium]